MKEFSNSNFAMFLHFLFEGNQTQDVSYISSRASKKEKEKDTQKRNAEEMEKELSQAKQKQKLLEDEAKLCCFGLPFYFKYFTLQPRR